MWLGGRSLEVRRKAGGGPPPSPSPPSSTGLGLDQRCLEGDRRGGGPWRWRLIIAPHKLQAKPCRTTDRWQNSKIVRGRKTKDGGQGNVSRGGRTILFTSAKVKDKHWSLQKDRISHVSGDR